MQQLLVILSIFLLVSCADKIDVSQFHLRGEQSRATPVKLIKAEATYRYDNNLETQDRSKKHGHYYVIRWNKIDASAPLTVKFQYIQADSGRTPKTLHKDFTNQSNGKVEFQVTGADYSNNGRVLAWRAELIQNGQVIASDESFLWNASR